MPTDAPKQTLTYFPRADGQLPGGDYTLKVTLTAPELSQTSWETEQIDAHQTVRVLAPEYSLLPSDIRAVWPPRGGKADFSDTFPHVELARTTLPWERSLSGGEPWLAVLVLRESDFETATLPRPVARKVTEVLAPEDARVIGPKSPPPQNGPDSCVALDLPLKLFQTIAPKQADLPFLAHTRETRDANGALVRSGSLVMSNRVPGALGADRDAHFMACLVSLNGHEKHLPPNPIPAGTPDNALIRLVLLHSWTFQLDQPGRNYSELAALSYAPIKGPKITTQDPALREALWQAAEAGYAPLFHQTRNGKNTVSWYRGPLQPKGARPIESSLIRHSDELLSYSPETQMFDTTLAAAFQLGQLMALKDRHFTRSLIAFRRRSSRQALEGSDQLALPNLAKDPNRLVREFLKARGIHEERDEGDEIPPGILKWLSDLSVLKSVPLRYLLPDPAMLGQNELRFFYLSGLWVKWLLAGACTPGRGVEADAELDVSLQKEVHDLPARQLKPKDDGTYPAVNWPLGGFVLRSPLVATWGELDLHAVGKRIPREGGTATEGTLELLRSERIAPDVLFCLYNGHPDRFEARQPATTVHHSSKSVGEEMMSEAGTIDASKFGENQSSVQYAQQLTDRPDVFVVNVVKGVG